MYYLLFSASESYLLHLRWRKITLYFLIYKASYEGVTQTNSSSNFLVTHIGFIPKIGRVYSISQEHEPL